MSSWNSEMTDGHWLSILYRSYLANKGYVIRYSCVLQK